MVFDKIYRTVSSRAIHAVYIDPGRAKAAVNELRRFFIEQNADPARWHKQMAKEHFLPWDKLKSNDTCLVCLGRPPELVLSCGHATCIICFQRFGELVPGHHSRYTIPRCTLCGTGAVTKDIRPPTAGVRVLSIDGGGVRGVAPLEYLSVIQSILNNSCKVQDLFDLAVGTSSGM